MANYEFVITLPILFQTQYPLLMLLGDNKY